MGDSYYDFRYVFYEHNTHKPLPEFKIQGQDVILIFVADENSTVPLELCDKFFAIFKNFYPLEENVRNIVAFPIGYSNSAVLMTFRPFEERKYDASYAGNFLANRLDFYRQFTWLRFLPPVPIQSTWMRKVYCRLLTRLRIYRPRMFRDTFRKSICYWSGGFAKGLPRDEYAEIISETRIALCPMGFKNTECFRLLETMRMGCVIVADVLPPSPVVQRTVRSSSSGTGCTSAEWSISSGGIRNDFWKSIGKPSIGGRTFARTKRLPVILLVRFAD